MAFLIIKSVELNQINSISNLLKSKIYKVQLDIERTHNDKHSITNLKNLVLLTPAIISISYINNGMYIYSDRKEHINKPIEHDLKKIISLGYNPYLLSPKNSQSFSYLFKFGTGYYKINYYRNLLIKNIHNNLTKFKIYNIHEKTKKHLFRSYKIIDNLDIVISSGINTSKLFILLLFTTILSSIIVIKLNRFISQYFNIHNSVLRLINKGVSNDEFIPYYQNVYSLTENKFIAAEVLCRWDRNGNILTPNHFIHQLEQLDSIKTVTLNLIKQAFDDLNSIYPNEKYLLSFNFTVAMILDKPFIDKVIDFIENTPNVKNKIIIELTESDNRFKHLADIRTVMLRLKEYGVLLSIDDFGTGYSNLLTIQELPFDIMKIDRAFISSQYAVSNSNMLEMMVSLGKSMNLLIVVEGVETKKELIRVKDLNVDCCQGFYYSIPSNSETFKQSLLQIK